MSGRLTWRYDARETGLRAVGAGPRARIGKVDGEDVYRVAPNGGNWEKPLAGWYWYGDGVNTYLSKPIFATWKEAQDDCAAYHKAKTAAQVTP